MEAVPTSTGWPRFMRLADIADHRLELFLGGDVYLVRHVLADHGLGWWGSPPLPNDRSHGIRAASVSAVPVMPDSFL